MNICAARALGGKKKTLSSLELESKAIASTYRNPDPLQDIFCMHLTVGPYFQLKNRPLLFLPGPLPCLVFLNQDKYAPAPAPAPVFCLSSHTLARHIYTVHKSVNRETGLLLLQPSHYCFKFNTQTCRLSTLMPWHTSPTYRSRHTSTMQEHTKPEIIKAKWNSRKCMHGHTFR